VTLDSSYLVCLCPLTFDVKLFSRGHPQVFSSDEIARFDTEYQKQLSFNFSATRASRKKSATMLDAPSSRHRDVDLDIAPSLFSRDTTDRLELSQYILEDLLNCKVDCRIIVCIRSGAKGDETEASYSDQARSIASSRNNSGITTELWRMSGEMYHVLQGTISRSSFSNKVMTGNLSESRFLHYFHTCRGDFGISFNGTNKVLSVPWYDVIHYSKTVMFLGSASISCARGAPSFGSRLIPNMHTLFSGALLLNTLETLVHPPNSLPLTGIACVAYIGHVVITQGLRLGRQDGHQALIQIVLGCFNSISIYIANWHSITASQNSTTTQCRLYKPRTSPTSNIFRKKYSQTYGHSCRCIAMSMRTVTGQH
jgi:hypothetical protein